MYKQIWIALALTATVVMVFGWWKDWDFSKTLSLDNDWKGITETASQSKQVAQDFIGSALEEQKQTALSSVDKAKESIITNARQQAATVINTLEKGIGLTKIDQTVGSSFIFIATVQVNELASFMVKNNTNELSNFTIDWGDGNQTNGTLSPEEEKLISHSWQTVGDHKITSDGQEFLIRVIK